jgi:hypothetical protein
MKRLSPRRVDGTKRYRPDIPPKPLAKQRTKRANGRLVLDGRSARGRRLKELIQIYSVGLSLEDGRIAGLVKSTASIAYAAEQLEDAIDRGEVVNHFALVRLVNTRERNLTKLKELKAQAQPAPSPIAKGPGGWSSPLQQHLHLMVWLRHRCGNANSQDPALIAEYGRLEAAGEFLDAVR